MIDAPQALVISGVYGVGKTTTTGQIADLLEERGAHYAALDLDWLSWAWTTDGPDEPVDRLMLEHLDLLVRNLRRRGNDRFVLAGAVLTQVEWDAIRTTMAMPTRFVMLTAPLPTILERMGSEPTSGRADDAAHAAQMERWQARAGNDVPSPDLEIANDGSIVETAQAILDWTGWLGPGETPAT